METRRTLLVDAFTSEPLSGNVAGVVPDADGLTDEQMQAVAAELGASETAFVLAPEPESDAARRLRYFTPTTEVDLCGHATVGAYAALFADGAVDPGTETLATAVGDLPITVSADGTVRMRQEAPTVQPVEVDYDRLGEALGIDPAALRDVGADLPVAVASTGLPFLIVPVNFLEHLGGASPDDDAVEALADEYDAAGVYAFTFDAVDGDSTLHARAFAPGAGISEDPVTGTASGACGAYLDAVDAFDGELPERMRFEQGHFVDRPGHVDVWVDGSEVSVGGEAVVSLEGELGIPDFAEDEIIEV